MTFENLNLALLSLLLTILTMGIYYYRGRSNKVFGADNFDPKFINSLFSRGNLNMIRAKFFLRYLSLFILVFAIAGLKTGTTVKPVERKGKMSSHLELIK
jgi:Ca-activated chloride channel family protein